MIRVALDTNVLAYLAGVDRHPSDSGKIGIARRLIGALGDRAALIAPVQALGELFVVLSRAGASRPEARDIVMQMHAAFAHADTGIATLLSALDAGVAHQLQVWDAIILTAAAEAGCTYLLSEDMHHGFAWRGTTILNPFSEPADKRLLALTV